MYNKNLKEWTKQEINTYLLAELIGRFAGLAVSVFIIFVCHLVGIF